jgi:hypothetical protein
VAKNSIGTTIVCSALSSYIDGFWFSVDKDAVSSFDFVSVKCGKARVIGIVDNLKVIPKNDGTSYSEEGVTVAEVSILAHSSPEFSPDMPVTPGKRSRLETATR